MKKNRSTGMILIRACALAACLCAAGMQPSAAEETPQSTAAEKQSIPVKEQTTKKKAPKTPDTFVPSDTVSADRAVAFPTDI